MLRQANILTAWALLLPSLCLGQWRSHHLPTPEWGTVFIQDELATVSIEVGDAIELIYDADSVWSYYEHPASFIYESSTFTDTVYDVGFRLRGNTSREAEKKSFKVAFDSFEEGNRWLGVKKLNLNGEHNDVSMMRSRMVWQLMRDADIPVSRTTHVKLYINGFFHGVYALMEHVDKDWLAARFDQPYGNLWKCRWPADLTYEGPAGEDYMVQPDWSMWRTYDLKTNNLDNNYDALAEFIDVLNNAPIESLPCELERIFDVQAYLRVAAAEILCGHWDNYIANRNNFYLYERATDGRLEYLPFDVDNTLGVQWFGNWTDMDPYEFNLGEERPLFERLLEVTAYKQGLTNACWELLNAGFSGEAVGSIGADWVELLEEAAEADLYRTYDYGFTFEGFQESVEEAWGGHVAYGLSEFMWDRAAYATIQLDDTASTSVGSAWSPGPVVDDTLRLYGTFNTQAGEVNAGAWVSWDNDDPMYFTLTEDVVIPDAYFAHLEIPTGTTKAAYQLEFIAPDGGLYSFPCTAQTVWCDGPESGIVLNEVMPRNDSFIEDESEENPDWVEFWNGSASAVYLGNTYLTDRITEPWRWPLPSVTLEPGQHLLIYCDGDTQDGVLHASFNLNASADTLYLTHFEDGAWRVLDQLSWFSAWADYSFGRSTDGAEDWTWFAPDNTFPPTPNSANGIPIHVARHPAPNDLTVLPKVCTAGTDWNLSTGGEWRILDASGVRRLTGSGNRVPTADFSPGIYFIELISTTDKHFVTSAVISSRP